MNYILTKWKFIKFLKWLLHRTFIRNLNFEFGTDRHCLNCKVEQSIFHKIELKELPKFSPKPIFKQLEKLLYISPRFLVRKWTLPRTAWEETLESLWLVGICERGFSPRRKSPPGHGKTYKQALSVWFGLQILSQNFNKLQF